jgi:hypothetical protein
VVRRLLIWNSHSDSRELRNQYAAQPPAVGFRLAAVMGGGGWCRLSAREEVTVLGVPSLRKGWKAKGEPRRAGGSCLGRLVVVVVVVFVAAVRRRGRREEEVIVA